MKITKLPKNYGTLTVITGPMFAGKSTELLKRILWAESGQNLRVEVLKPSFDNRYSETEIKSHDGLKAPAKSISEWPQFQEKPNVIFIDEVQFLSEARYSGNIISDIKKCLEKSIDVTVSGLDCDWQGLPFPITANLLAMADIIIKIPSHCFVCGSPATKTFKNIPDNSKIALGTDESYQARCNHHWHTLGLENDPFKSS